MITTRLFVFSACLALTACYLSVTLRSEPVVERSSFVDFPGRVAGWSGMRNEALDPAIVSTLGVDEYVNRYYTSGHDLAHLYVGYYRTQREGDTIHSPMNCLPGAGWLPVSTGTMALQTASGPVRVNRYIIQKGLDRQMVLYWYQSHGRTVASDYWSKIYLVIDSIRFNRTDAALVRVIAPFDDASPEPESLAERTAASFATTIYPLLSRYLPR